MKHNRTAVVTINIEVLTKYAPPLIFISESATLSVPNYTLKTWENVIEVSGESLTKL